MRTRNGYGTGSGSLGSAWMCSVRRSSGSLASTPPRHSATCAPIRGNRLEKLRGRRQGQHSIRINDQWHICFVWTDAGPEDVEIVDYH